MKQHTPIDGTEAQVVRESLVSKKAAAAHCSVTTRTVDQWMSEGRLPYYKIGRTVRFRLSEVDVALNETCRVARKGDRQ